MKLLAQHEVKQIVDTMEDGTTVDYYGFFPPEGISRDDIPEGAEVTMVRTDLTKEAPEQWLFQPSFCYDGHSGSVFYWELNKTLWNALHLLVVRKEHRVITENI